MDATNTARWSTEAYANEATSGFIPLLMLSFSGEGRSTMRHHFSGIICKPLATCLLELSTFYQ